jgi:hypothetical protein
MTPPVAKPVASSRPQEIRHIETRLSVNLDRVGKIANAGILLALVGSVISHQL